MSTRYDLGGRTNQKQRTRAALIAAARALVAKGVTPTVEDAAEVSAISRTTAYRYFPNQAELLAAAHPEIETVSLLPRDPPSDVVERVAIVVRAFTRTIVQTESQQRTMLRLSLEGVARDKLLLRKGRAIAWIEEALEPLRPKLSPKKIRRLACAIRASIGIEALVWLVDVGGLSRKEALASMRWSAQAIVRAAIPA